MEADMMSKDSIGKHVMVKSDLGPTMIVMASLIFSSFHIILAFYHIIAGKYFSEYYRGIFEGFSLHDMAPMAGGVADGQKYQLILSSGPVR